jgi:TRAP-type mannitol/chloroaromatic compound transport system substrate-binding protein
MAAEIWQKMGMTTVNMPGGEIIPSAQRGVIDCAEWVGGVEDLRLGFHNVWKYHYTPGMHENVTIGEVLVNMDVWKSLKPEHQELMKSVASETFVVWWAKWQRQNADALKELQEKHGVRVLRTPGDILVQFLKTWDKVAAEEAQKSPFFKKTLESQRQYASLVVPAKRFMFPPYSFAANYYFPEGGSKGAKADAKKK